MSSDIVQMIMAAGVVLSLVLHYLGRKHPVAEKAAEVVDTAEALGKDVGVAKAAPSAPPAAPAP